ncbi:MAG: hypothetical protein IPJ67_00095 [Candidatus Moraniibacteriota bacterium]|nr:MAG: hypothetical protein IPJ67_00095 [Candidatus Moranbacteria bacterium]
MCARCFWEWERLGERVCDIAERSDPRRYLLHRGWELRQLHLRRQRQRYNADHYQEMHCERSRTETGYSSAYCDGQAVFGSFIFASDYWIIDGATRNESNWADGGAYGFRVSTFSANTSFSPGVCASNLTMQYVNAGGTPTETRRQAAWTQHFYIGGFDEYCQNWTMSHNYVHDTITTYHMNGVRGGLIEYSYIVNGWSKGSDPRSNLYEQFSIRHNIFKDSCQGNPADPTAGACTGTIALFDGFTKTRHTG